MKHLRAHSLSNPSVERVKRKNLVRRLLLCFMVWFNLDSVGKLKEFHTSLALGVEGPEDNFPFCYPPLKYVKLRLEPLTAACHRFAEQSFVLGNTANRF